MRYLGWKRCPSAPTPTCRTQNSCPLCYKRAMLTWKNWVLAVTQKLVKLINIVRELWQWLTRSSKEITPGASILRVLQRKCSFIFSFTRCILFPKPSCTSQKRQLVNEALELQTKRGCMAWATSHFDIFLHPILRAHQKGYWHDWTQYIRRYPLLSTKKIRNKSHKYVLCWHLLYLLNRSIHWMQIRSTGHHDRWNSQAEISALLRYMDIFVVETCVRNMLDCVLPVAACCGWMGRHSWPGRRWLRGRLIECGIFSWSNCPH